MEEFLKKLEDISWVNSSHLGVCKKIFYSQESFESNITQVAYAELLAKEEIPIHIHPTMEEVFFLLKGVCEFTIDNETYLVKSQSSIRIPANVKHSLRAISNSSFYYIGVSI